MRTPIVMVSGIDARAMASAIVGLQFDLPDAVCVHHAIDPVRQVLTRIVSDAAGVLERHETELAHACVGCAIREDIVPTLERLARERRWSTIIAHLPVGAEAAHVCSVLTWDPNLARVVTVSSVVTALAAGNVVHDLLGDDLLAERGLHSGPDDRRGVGEVLCAMVEYSDVVVFEDEPAPLEQGLVTALARPDVEVSVGGHALEATSLLAGRHIHGRTEAWIDPLLLGRLPSPPPGVWRLDMGSERPFHPQRLLESVDLLGTGEFRTRGCFWLPTRPEVVVGWDGAGGQVSIGEHDHWDGRVPFTRIVCTGVGEAPPPHLLPGFGGLLMAPDEALAPGGFTWGDGFEPWLGPIKEVA